MTVPPRFHNSSEDTELMMELTQRVDERLEGLPTHRVAVMRMKAVLLPLIYFALYAIAVTNGDNPFLYRSCFAAMAVFMVLMYLNIIHDAAHQNVFSASWPNKVLMHIFDLVGANSYIWRHRHMSSHHRFPNVDGWDTDVEQSGIIAIYPHVKPNNVQKYQHWFCFFIYPTYLFNWLLFRDFKDFFDKSRVIHKAIRGGIPVVEKVKLFFFKFFYLFYQIAVPIIFFGVSWKLALGAWAIQVALASVIALFVLLPLHPLLDNEFPLPNNEGKMPFSWIRHQLLVTNDLDNNNWVTRNILGGFNFHVAHHLFPNVPHVYYDELTDELKKFAKEKGLRYASYPILSALGMHYQLLKKNAEQMFHVMEESM